MIDIDRLVTDPIYCVEQIWVEVGSQRVAPLGPPEHDIIRYVLNPDNEFPKERYALGPRSLGKTYLLAACCCALLRANPDEKIGFVSKSGGHAKNTLHMIRSWLNHVWFLEDLKPAGDLRDTAIGFDVAGASPLATMDRTFSVFAVGIEGQMPGLRATWLFPDDIETDENVVTVDARARLAGKSDEFVSIATYGRQQVVGVGTPWHRESLYTHVLPKKNVMVRTWPILYPQPDERVTNLAPSLVADLESGKAKPGDRVFPHRHSPEYIAERKAKGRHYFAMQQMCIADIPDRDVYPFKLSDLIVWPCASIEQAPNDIAWGTVNANGASTAIPDSGSDAIPNYGWTGDAMRRPIKFSQDFSPWQDTRMRVDPASTGKDPTAYAVASRLGAKIYLRAVAELRGESSNQDATVLDAIAHAAFTYRVRTITVEKNFGGDAFATLLQAELRKKFVQPGSSTDLPGGWSCTVETVQSRGQKELRIIQQLEPVLGSHRLVVDDNVARNPAWQRQFTNLTREPGCLDHDDLIETTAAVVSDFPEALNASPERLDTEAARQREIQKMVAWGNTHGRNVMPPEPNWIVKG
jgi:hypothetical protein